MMRNLTRQLARMFHRLDDDTLDVTQFQSPQIDTAIS